MSASVGRIHEHCSRLRYSDVYKPKLEEILNDIIVMTEIAELGAEADNLPDDTENQFNAKQLVEANLKRRGQLSEVRWSSVKFQKGARNRTSSTDSNASPSPVQPDSNADTSLQDSPVPEKESKDFNNPRSFVARTSYTSNSSGLVRIKNLLDRWEEPVNKLDKVRLAQHGSFEVQYPADHAFVDYRLFSQ